MHLIAFYLNLMAAHNSHEIVVIKQLFGRFLTEQVRAFALFIINVVSIVGDVVREWVRPEEVTK